MPLIKSQNLRALPRARTGMLQLQSLLNNVADDPFWETLVDGVPAHPVLDGLERQHKPRGMDDAACTYSAAQAPAPGVRAYS